MCVYEVLIENERCHAWMLNKHTTNAMHVHELKNNAKEASLEEDKRVLVIEAYKEVRDTCKDI